MGGNRYGGGSKSLMFPVQNIYVSFCVGIHPARQGGTVGFHLYTVGMAAIIFETQMPPIFSPKIHPNLSASAMMSLFSLRSLFRHTVSSAWEGRCRSVSLLSLRVFGAARGAFPESGACPEAAETESVDTMMQPDAGKRGRV